MKDATQLRGSVGERPLMHPMLTLGIDRSHEREVAARASPLTILPVPARRALRWRVDWESVMACERWLDRELRGTGVRRVIAETQVGNLTLKGVIKTPEERAYGGLMISGPKDGRTIHGVLLSRCAGYVKAPRAEDVVCGLKASTPNETQAEAIRTFLREATVHEVREAWKAGEFSLTALMRALELLVDKDDTLTVHSVRQWLIVEPEPCEPNR